MAAVLPSAYVVGKVVLKIAELKDMVHEVGSNKERCTRLGNRLMMLNPALEAFEGAYAEGRSESADMAALTICTLVEEICTFVVQYKKYEGRGPTIWGHGVADYFRKAINQDGDNKAFAEFNTRLRDFAADLGTLSIKTSAWSNEDALDKRADGAAGAVNNAAAAGATNAQLDTGTLEQSYRFEPDEASSYVGEGSIGEVRMVKHIHDGEVRAVKMIKTRRAASVGLDENALKQEARSMLRLCHPNILRYHTSCWHSTPREGRIFCMVMEYAGGGTLRDWINNTRAAGRGVVGIDTDQVFKCMLQIGSGLHHMHFECRMIHRDLKPENVLLDAGNNASRSPVWDWPLATRRGWPTRRKRARGRSCLRRSSKATPSTAGRMTCGALAALWPRC